MGQWPPATLQWRTERRREGDDWHPRLASRRESSLTAKNKRYSRISVGCINALRRKGPENPGVVAPLADAGCRGNRRRVVGRRLGKIDLRPCLLRLRSSLVVLGCTGLMRSTLFSFSSTVTKAWNMSIAITELASVLRHGPRFYTWLANLADDQSILALRAVGVTASP